MSRREWSAHRLRVWRCGWTALIAGMLLVPIAEVGTCSTPAEGVEWSGDTCTTQRAPLLGLILPIRYPAP